MLDAPYFNTVYKNMVEIIAALSEYQKILFDGLDASVSFLPHIALLYVTIDSKNAYIQEKCICCFYISGKENSTICIYVM